LQILLVIFVRWIEWDECTITQALHNLHRAARELCYELVCVCHGVLTSLRIWLG
jgi:hypothetical protein